MRVKHEKKEEVEKGRERELKKKEEEEEVVELEVVTPTLPNEPIPDTPREEKEEEENKESSEIAAKEPPPTASPSRQNSLVKQMWALLERKNSKIPLPHAVKLSDESVRYIGLQRIVKSVKAEALVKAEMDKFLAPPGWKEKISSKSPGQRYFVNTITGERLWPGDLQKRIEEEQGRGRGGSDAAKEGETATLEMVAIKMEDSLPGKEKGDESDTVPAVTSQDDKQSSLAPELHNEKVETLSDTISAAVVVVDAERKSEKKKKGKRKEEGAKETEKVGTEV